MAFSASSAIVVCPAERHIPVEVPELCAVLEANYAQSGDRKQFHKLLDLFISVVQHEFVNTKEQIKYAFSPFSAGARKATLNTSLDKGLPTTEQMKEREQQFLEKFADLMKSAHYELLTKTQWDLAQKENFQFYMPITVDWKALDELMLDGFWKRGGCGFGPSDLLPSELRNRILVFHRGVGLAKIKGRFINEKTDILVDGFVAWVKSLIKRSKAGNDKPLFRSDTSHGHARVVERRTLKHVLPTPIMVLKNLFRIEELQEPAFKEVIVLYRLATPNIERVTAGTVLTEKERLQNILQIRNIQLKSFGDIPFADVEVIFPKKSVFIATKSILQLVGTLIFALVTACITLWRAWAVINMNIVWSSLSVILARCGQVYSNMQTQRAELMGQMSDMLYEKTHNSQEGVIQTVLEDLADDRIKEALLAYSLLDVSSRAMTRGDLDDQCEEFLKSNFRVKLDFALEDTLPHLERWGLIRSKGDKYEAVTVEEAIEKLQVIWVESVLGRGAVPQVTAKSDQGRAGNASPAPQILPPADKAVIVTPVDVSNHTEPKKRGLFKGAFRRGVNAAI